MSTRPFDEYVQWWQNAAARYLETFTIQPFLMRSLGMTMERYLETKRYVDRGMEEMWRSLRLTPQSQPPTG
jgi:hypothetical protein